MFLVDACALPANALLDRYRHGGAHTDCYVTSHAGDVSLARYVAAFYTTPVFKAERLILRLLLSRPSTDAEAAQLGAGTRDTFAAWRVEARDDTQLLLADLRGRTRSWLMVVPVDTGSGTNTRLYFGSAVIPQMKSPHSRPSLGPVFSALMGFHKLYSQVLLSAARSRLA
ncbi:MAG: hypothetical protein R3F24_03365 [Gammaproteobacteria bacterium]